MADPPPGIPARDHEGMPPAPPSPQPVPAAPPVGPAPPIAPVPPAGWAAWGPGQTAAPQSPGVLSHPAARIVVWIIGLGLLVLLASITAAGQAAGRSLSPEYRAGMVVGDLGFGLLAGAGIRWIWNRAGRGKEGARMLSALSIIPLAAVVMVLPLLTSLGRLRGN
jgi:hypothetical protein